jgi:putative colanic acid biosynthesis UDP-glucose lipid carrier transferase
MTSNQPPIRPSWSLCDLVYRFLDVIGILVGMVVAIRLQGRHVDVDHLLASAAAAIVFYLMCEITGLYRNWRGVSIEREILCAVVSWTITVPLLLALGVMTKYAQWVDRSFVLTWFCLTLVLIVASRMFVRMLLCFLRARGFNGRGYAIVGVNELGIELVKRIENAPELGLHLVGFYDDRQEARLPAVRDMPHLPKIAGQKLGSIDRLLVEARAGRVNMIFITFPMRAEARIRSVLNMLSDTTASVYIVPDFFVFELLHSRWTNIGGLPAVSVFENPFYGIDGFLKRALDICLASLILLAASIPMLIIAAMVKQSSPGPVFFRQRRYGLDGREIHVWKFRTMTVCESDEEFRQATVNDPRVTRVGKILRRTSLDELPQLFNVLEGSMSLVGPRPHASLQNEEYRSRIQGYMLRHKVKPGITGLAQVSGWRGETDTLEKMEKRVECDHRYIREWTLLMDLKILLRTFLIVFSRHNAY